jgi:hypothetical protein
MSMPRAFLLEETDLDVTSASAFGAIEVLFSSNVPRPSIWSDDFEDRVLERLIEVRFNPDRDFIILTGQVVPLVRATTVVSEAYGHFKVLAFDTRDRARRYEPISLGAKEETTP